MVSFYKRVSNAGRFMANDSDVGCWRPVRSSAFGSLAIVLFSWMSLCWAAVGNGQSASTVLALDPPDDPVNVGSFILATDNFLLGQDQDKADLTGTMEATFGLSRTDTGYQIDELTFTGGVVSLDPVRFELGLGVTATADGLKGTPFTCMDLQDGICVDLSPGPIVDGVFDASHHGLIVEEGIVNAAGTVIDYSTMPFVGLGTGTGSVTMTAGSPVEGFDVLDVVLQMPIAFDSPFQSPSLPLVGVVNGSFTGTGLLRASGTLQIPALPDLACDADADGDCELDDLNAMYEDIDMGTQGGDFDFDGDGIVTGDDIEGWLTAASVSENPALPAPPANRWVLGDVELDGDVDSQDLGRLLNNFGGPSTLGWSGGDLDGNRTVDSRDLGKLINEFGTPIAPAAQAVPEPSTGFGLLCGLLGWMPLFSKRRALRV